MIDEQIREALDVDPSTEFLARVRTRIATEPAPTAWRWSWTIAASGALAAAAIAAIALTPAREKVVAPVTRTAEAGRQEPAVPQTDSVPSATARRLDSFRPARRLSPAVSERRLGSAVREASAAAPEILLDPAERRALQQLISGVRDGRVDLTAAQKSVSPTPMDLEPVTDIVIAPITIEPIAPPFGAEGVHP